MGVAWKFRSFAILLGGATLVSLNACAPQVQRNPVTYSGSLADITISETDNVNLVARQLWQNIGLCLIRQDPAFSGMIVSRTPPGGNGSEKLLIGRATNGVMTGTPAVTLAISPAQDGAGKKNVSVTIRPRETDAGRKIASLASRFTLNRVECEPVTMPTALTSRSYTPIMIPIYRRGGGGFSPKPVRYMPVMR
jgi:hypothetical protein